MLFQILPAHWLRVQVKVVYNLNVAFVFGVALCPVNSTTAPAKTSELLHATVFHAPLATGAAAVNLPCAVYLFGFYGISFVRWVKAWVWRVVNLCHKRINKP